jgi:SHS family lactate transporter-like MFS transporter
MLEQPKYDTWRVLYYVAAAFSIGAAVIRALLPESQYFIDRRNAEKASGHHVSASQKTKTFLKEAGRALKLHWGRCIFAVLLMFASSSFASETTSDCRRSQDVSSDSHWSLTRRARR